MKNNATPWQKKIVKDACVFLVKKKKIKQFEILQKDTEKEWSSIN